MKLIEITEQAGAREPLVKAARKYKKNIEAVLDKQLYFYRAAETHRPIMDSDYELSWYEQPARTAKRNSIFGNGNWLLSWIDATWKNYPSRALSYFATQSTFRAGHFGRGDQMLLIIPPDNVKNFGVMETDFNEASPEAHATMTGIQRLLSGIQRKIMVGDTPLLNKLQSQVFAHRGIDLDTHPLAQPSSENIKSYIEAIDELLDNIFQISQRASTREELSLLAELKDFRSELKDEGYATLEEYLQTISPKAMGAERFTDFGQIKSSPSKEDELWFEGRYLGIYVQDKEETLENLRELLSDL